MKRLLLLLLGCATGLQAVYAQQKPQYTQYMFNNYLLNPAVSGIENYTDVKAGYRSQWTGLTGAPVTSYLTINAPLGKQFIEGDATSMPNTVGGANPYLREYTREYTAAEPHHGIGGMVVTDKAGPITTTTLDATYAYHLGLNSRVNLAVGVMAGLEHVSLDLSQVTLENPDDPAIYNGKNNQWKPDLGVGVWAYSANYYVGASVQQLIKQNIVFGESSSYNQSKLVPHYFLTGGVKLFLTDEIAVLPSVLLKYVSPAPTSFDVNMKVAFSDILWVGGSYRHNDSFAAMTGINISSIINVGYSYDFTHSNLRTVSNGSHEVVIGILLNNRYKVRCPQRSW